MNHLDKQMHLFSKTIMNNENLDIKYSAYDALWNNLHQLRYWNNLHQLRYWNNLHQVRYWNNLHQVRYWNNLHQLPSNPKYLIAK